MEHFLVFGRIVRRRRGRFLVGQRLRHSQALQQLGPLHGVEQRLVLVVAHLQILWHVFQQTRTDRGSVRPALRLCVEALQLEQHVPQISALWIVVEEPFEDGGPFVGLFSDAGLGQDRAFG